MSFFLVMLVYAEIRIRNSPSVALQRPRTHFLVTDILQAARPPAKVTANASSNYIS